MSKTKTYGRIKNKEEEKICQIYTKKVNPGALLLIKIILRTSLLIASNRDSKQRHCAKKVKHHGTHASNTANDDIKTNRTKESVRYKRIFHIV